MKPRKETDLLNLFPIDSETRSNHSGFLSMKVREERRRKNSGSRRRHRRRNHLNRWTVSGPYFTLICFLWTPAGSAQSCQVTFPWKIGSPLFVRRPANRLPVIHKDQDSVYVPCSGLYFGAFDKRINGLLNANSISQLRLVRGFFAIFLLFSHG